MKSILCYGDSNTWGYNPVSGKRHNYENRWTSIMQKKLGDEYLVIPEGLNGRTTVWEDPIELHKNGAAYLPPCLESHKPLDLVIIMLGTNDLKQRFSLPAVDIAAGVGVLVDIVKKSGCGPVSPDKNTENGDAVSSPEVLVLIPPEVRKLSNFAEMFTGAREKSLKFPAAYASMAEERGVSFLDIGRDVRFSDADGIHFEPDQLLILGEMIAEKVKQFL
jgi:lysophospholipase L1-like esterase